MKKRGSSNKPSKASKTFSINGGKPRDTSKDMPTPEQLAAGARRRRIEQIEEQRALEQELSDGRAQ